MMGNEGSLSLSEIAGSERNDVSTKPSSDAPDSAIDELIEKWRHLDNGLPCLLDKTRQDISITKEALTFFKKRAAIEEEYGRQLSKLSQSTMESHDRQQLVSDSLSQAWTVMLKMHETIGEQRLKFGSDISEIVEDIAFLLKDIDKKRKMLNKNEDDARMKAAAADDQYKQQLLYSNSLRKDYFEKHLPKMLTTLKETDSVCCVALRYQIARYAYSFEQTVVANGKQLDNEEAVGMRTTIAQIDKDTDLRNYVDAHGGRFTSSQMRELKYEKYEMAVKVDEQPAVPKALSTVVKSRPVFGVELQQLLDQEGSEVPMILRVCTQTIEAYGLHNQGIYRVSGAASHIRKVKSLIEQGKSTTMFHLAPEDYSGDINSVTGALKLWFRELPDPLIPRRVSDQFIAAAKCEDERVRVISLHTAINDLPDPNYATLRYLASHLDKIQQHEVYNKMGTPNLAIIFGPTLMGGDKEGYTFDESKTLQDMQWHVRVIEIILENYRVIFEPDDE
ncbi:unnamed protein product [Umbelopsis vinacea]